VPNTSDRVDWRLAATPDLNDDGSPDILWQNTSDGRIRVWYMNYLTRTSTVDLPVSVGDPNWKIVATGDLNADHRPDFIWQHQTAGWLAAWFMDGIRILDTQFLSINRVTDPDWKIAGAGDLNGDNRADLVWQHLPAGRQAVWFMDGSTVLDTRFFAYYGTATYVGDVNWKIGAVGYFDHDDNHADVIWQHLRYGWVAVWAMDGNAVLDTHNLNGRSSVSDMNLRIVAPK
jgi:hypothetical protein